MLLAYINTSWFIRLSISMSVGHDTIFPCVWAGSGRFRPQRPRADSSAVPKSSERCPSQIEERDHKDHSPQEHIGHLAMPRYQTSMLTRRWKKMLLFWVWPGMTYKYGAFLSFLWVSHHIRFSFAAACWDKLHAVITRTSQPHRRPPRCQLLRESAPPLRPLLLGVQGALGAHHTNQIRIVQVIY